MARGAAQARRKRTKAEAARRRRRAQTAAPTSVAEKTMFFPKLRRQAKWVFVFLAAVFALGFVVFGVGSGGGIGLGDLFSSDSSSQTASESKAREEIKKDPDNAQAYQDLANALQTKGDLRGAAGALEKFSKLQPRNAESLASLAGLYTALGTRLQSDINEAQLASQENGFATQVNKGLESRGQPVSTNVIDQSIATLTNAKLTELYQKQQDDFTRAETVNKEIVALNPKDANAQLNLGQAAQSAGDVQGAIAAYQKFMKLAPDDPTVSLVKQQIKALRQSAQSTSVPAG